VQLQLRRRPVSLSTTGHEVHGHTIDVLEWGRLLADVNIYRDGIVTATAKNSCAYTVNTCYREPNAICPAWPCIISLRPWSRHGCRYRGLTNREVDVIVTGRT